MSLRRRAGSRRRVLGAGRRLLTRAASRLPDSTYTAPTVALQAGNDAGPRARLAVLVGRFWLAVEQPHRAQRAFERAVRDGDASALTLLGTALLNGGPIDIGVTEHLGLAWRPVGDAVAAERSFSSALAGDGRSRRARRGVVQALLDRGELDAAAQRAADADDCDDLRAMVQLRMLEQNGSLTRAGLASVAPLLESHVRRHPEDATARDRLARIQLSILDFDGAESTVVAIPPPGVTRTLVEWTRHTVAGDHVAAYRVKRDAADVIAAGPAHRTGSVGALALRIQSVNFVDGPDRAAAELERSSLVGATSTERSIHAKMRADLAFLDGDVRPLERLIASYPIPNPHSEQRFRDLVRDRKVLLVGPAPAHQPSLAEITAHDTVVTTRRAFDFPAGTERDTIVYLTNEAARDEVLGPRFSRDRHGPLLVVRPSIVRQLIGTQHRSPHVRVQPFEDSTPLFGTHFALQRILHDLAAHGAATITLAGADFFLGEQTHVDGYAAGTTDRFASVPFNFSHDFAYDFWYTRRLRDTGMISAAPAVGDLLDQPVESYLRRLGRVFH